MSNLFFEFCIGYDLYDSYNKFISLFECRFESLRLTINIINWCKSIFISNKRYKHKCYERFEDNVNYISNSIGIPFITINLLYFVRILYRNKGRIIF